MFQGEDRASWDGGRWVGEWGQETPRGEGLGTHPLEEVLGSVLLMPVLAGFRSYARCPCSSPREKLGPVPVTTGAAQGNRTESEGTICHPGALQRGDPFPNGIGYEFGQNLPSVDQKIKAMESGQGRLRGRGMARAAGRALQTRLGGH